MMFNFVYLRKCITFKNIHANSFSENQNHQPMKKGVFLLFLLFSCCLDAQYYQDFEGWSFRSQGDWTVTDATGTYTTGGTYLNFGFSVSGYLKLGFNNTGDFMEFPPIPNPAEISFMARISSPGSATFLVQIFDNGSWVTTDEIPILETNYLQYKVVVSSANNASTLPFRLVLKEFFGQSIFFDNFSADHSLLLPVALSDFSGSATSQGIYINWTTERESDNDYFTVQRSNNPLDQFFDISVIPGHQQSEQMVDYQYLDFAPLPGKNYYRLKQVDIGGAVHYSDVIETEFYPNRQNFLVYPTIAQNNLTVLTQDLISSSSYINIVDQAGRKWLNQLLESGNQVTTLDISHLPNGRYFIQWKNSSNSSVKSFFKS